uniref:Uncharacterized protein n=1 Tax=Amphimedon queenslandica TaxID=400682 RepID=A0A1X7U899_AMPQE
MKYLCSNFQSMETSYSDLSPSSSP